MRTTLHAASLDSPLWEQAFPAAWWRTVLGGVTVRLHVPDTAAVLHGSIGGDHRDLGSSPTGVFEIDLGPSCCDFYWLAAADRRAGEQAPGSARDLHWEVEIPADVPRICVVMPTYRREQDATAQAGRFAAMDLTDTVFVIDQGDTLRADPGFTSLLARSDSAELPGRIELISQQNRGGSGGYARGMLATLERPGTAVLLSDDDAVIGEESLRRMVTFQALAADPVIVGSGLFSAEQPLRLTAHAETVDPRTFQWIGADALPRDVGVDLTDTTPADWDLLRVRRPITYTGWWGTLLPPGTVSELGLPAPFFLKWDDAEYGLRATARGYRHAVLPGASVHHPSWDAFRTQMSWSARILHRNRLATAAAVGAGPGVIASSFTHQVKHVLAGHHLTALLWDAGARAAAEGPDTWLGTDLDRARTDGQQIVDTYTASRPAPEALPVSARRRHRPYSLPLGALRALVRVLGLERPVRSVLELSADAVSWRSTLGAGAVLVTTADGEPLGVLSATGREDRSLLRRTVATHLRLLCRWPRLRRRYRSALPQVTTAAAWTRMLGLDGRSSRTGGADSIGRDGRTR